MVQDDVVLFTQGSQICADAVVLDGYVEANEALVTGESETVKKQVGDTLLSGSFVSSGQCFAKLTQVGDHSYAAKLAAEAKKHKKINSELLNSLNKIIKTVGYVLIPMGILLLVKQYATIAGEGAFSTFQFSSFSVAVTKTVAALTGMIPEGLYLLTSVALAVSMIRLVQQKALVQEMYAIESLARVDVLCIDKTGTITSGRMHVQTVENLTDEDIASRMMPSILLLRRKHYQSILAKANDTKPYELFRFLLHVNGAAVLFRIQSMYLVRQNSFYQRFRMSCPRGFKHMLRRAVEFCYLLGVSRWMSSIFQTQSL